MSAEKSCKEFNLIFVISSVGGSEKSVADKYD